MPEFSDIEIAFILLGFAPGALLGLLGGYWFIRAAFPPPPRYAAPAPRVPETPPLGAVLLGAAALAQQMATPVRPQERNAVLRPRTEPAERADPLAPGLNEYGEIVDPRDR